jgi:hypothetical protein
MKKIRLRTNLFNGNEKITSAGILRLVCGNSPQRPLSIEEIRRRVRILDALDEATKPGDGGTLSEVLSLEDEDHKALCAAIEGFPWVNASKGLLTIIDDVLQAETAKTPAMKVVKE